MHGQHARIWLDQCTVARRAGKLQRYPPRRLDVINFPTAIVVFVADRVHSNYTFSQYSESGATPGRQDLFNDRLDYDALKEYCVSMYLSLCIRAKIERRSSLGSLSTRKVIVQDHSDQRVRVDLVYLL